MSFSKIRTALSAAIALGVLWVFIPGATTGCGGGTCSQSQQDACTSAHSACVPACNPLLPGTTTPDPNYTGCVQKCNDNQCTCLSDCGDVGGNCPAK